MVRPYVAFVGEDHAARPADLHTGEVDGVRQVQVDTRVRDVVDVDAELAPVAQEGADLVTLVADDDPYLTDAERIAQQLDVPLDDRHPVHGEERLRYRVGIRVGADASSRRGNQADEIGQRGGRHGYDCRSGL